MKLLISVLMMIAICLPAIAYEKENNTITIYEGLHIPIKFVETIDLAKVKKGDKVTIAVNEDSCSDEDVTVFKEDSKGVAFVTEKNGKWNIDTGKLKDVYGNEHIVDIKGFYLKDFQEGNKYIIPKDYVIDAFIKEKKVLH